MAKPDLMRRMSITADLEPGFVDAAIRGALVRRRGRPAEPARPGWRAFQLGSALSFRIWGIWGLNGHRRLPLIASWWATLAGSASEVDIILASNEGWYLTYPEFGLRKFEQHLHEVERDIRAALGHPDL
ncbi:MAG: hypothetical protein WBL06_13750 [Pseudolysinimonas sp.]|uniref:hypothetical protein n=1 Tax=Pseudolysinimonas sp. TaxID=2680009 RepID=UPI003C761B97